MKHIKKIKRLKFREFKFGDIVKVSKYIASNPKIKIGDICKIADVDYEDDDIPYFIEKINLTNNINDDRAWITSNQIEKAEDYDIDANKYNL